MLDKQKAEVRSLCRTKKKKKKNQSIYGLKTQGKWKKVQIMLLHIDVVEGNPPILAGK